MKYKVYISASESELSQYHQELLSHELKKHGGWRTKIWRSNAEDVKRTSAGVSKLPESVQLKLQAAEHFIFFAETKIDDSATCLLELEYWCKILERSDQLIIVLINGQIEVDIIHERIDWAKTNALPQLLKDIIPSIPLFLDLQFVQQFPLDIDLLDRYQEAIIPLRAKLENRTPDELSGKEYLIYLRNKKRRAWLLGLLFVLAIGSGFFSFYARKMSLREDKNLGLAIEKEEEAQRLLRETEQHTRKIQSDEDQEQRSSIEAQRQQQVGEYNRNLSRRNLSLFKESLKDFLMIKAWENMEDHSRLSYLLTEEAIKLSPDIGYEIKDSIANYFSLSFHLPNESRSAGLDTIRRLSNDRTKFAFLVKDSTRRLKLKVWDFAHDTIFNFGVIHQDNFIFDKTGKRIFYINNYDNNTNHFSWNYWDFETQQFNSFKNCYHFGMMDEPQMAIILSPDDQKMAFLTDYQEATDESTLNVWSFKQQKLVSNKIKGLPLNDWPWALLRFSNDGEQIVYLTHSEKSKKVNKLHIWDFNLDKTNTFDNVGTRDASLWDIFFGKRALIFPTAFDADTYTSQLVVWKKGEYTYLPFPEIFPEEFSFFPDEQRLAFFSNYTGVDQSIRLNIYDLKTKKHITFDSIYYPNEYFFSPGSRISDRYDFVLGGQQLVYYTKGRQGNLDLNIYDFDQAKTRTISGIHMTYPEGYNSFLYQNSHLVPDYEYNHQKTKIAFWTDGPNESKLFNYWDFEHRELREHQVLSSFYDVDETRLYILDTIKNTFFWQSETGFHPEEMDIYQLGPIDHQNLKSFRTDCLFGPYYAYQYNYIIYWTDCVRNNYSSSGTLNIYDVNQGREVISVKNSYPFEYAFAKQGRFFLFFTRGNSGSDLLTLVVYDLKEDSAKHFTVAGSPKFVLSQDEEKLAFLQENEKTVTVINLENGSILRQSKHRNLIYDYQFMNDDNFIVTQSRASHSKHQIMKFFPLINEQKLFHYYAEKFLPLTEEERLQYGLLGVEEL